MPESDPATFWIAIAALGISAAALALEVRRWMESGVKLSVACAADMVIVYAGEKPDPRKQYLTVDVANRGDMPTTITNLGMVIFPSRFGKLRNRASQHFLCPWPSKAQPLPFLLEPGARWSAQVRQGHEIEEALENGTLWALVFATHSEKSAMARITRRATPKGKVMGSAAS